MKLKKFQKLTVEYIYERLLDAKCQRFLCADEVGLGKTLIAKGVIDKFLEVRGGSLKVFYICSSQYLAQRNLTKLHPESQKSPISRLTELITRTDLIGKNKGLSILPLSPKTSVDLRSRGGKTKERVILYWLLKSFEPLKGRWDSSFDRILKLGVKSWSHDKMNAPYLDEKIVKRFHKKIRNNKQLMKLLLECFDQQSGEYLKLIGELRTHLAAVSLDTYKPDLIILDEFQRFSEILKESENEDASDLVKTLFSQEHTEMLLLSATPYRMYTIRQEQSNNNSHYEEFDFLMKFLMGDDYKFFLKDWKAYSDGILSLNYFKPDELELLKDKVEAWLFKYVCRTERSMAYAGKPESSLIKSHYFPLKFNANDINNFISTDRVVELIEQKNPEIYSAIEYCKTAPYPLSFMDKYKLKNLFNDLQKESLAPLNKVLKNNSECLISYNTINNYQDITFPNAKMEWLIEENVKRGAMLLWIPPCIPFYRLEGPFSMAQGFSKIMSFGKFAVEPRAISVLASFKHEILTTGSQIAQKAAGDQKARKYFTSIVESEIDTGSEDAETTDRKRSSRKPGQRLLFKNDDSSYSILCFYYPSIYLAEVARQNLALIQDSTLHEVRIGIVKKIKESVAEIKKFARRTERTDTRWYLFALLYLDYKFVIRELEIIGSNQFIDSSIKMPKRAGNILKYINTIINNGPETLADELNLGTPPDDLPDVLAAISIGAPATLLYQVFLEYFPESNDGNFSNFVLSAWKNSFFAAEGFRSYYNQPEHISILDMVYENRNEDFWLKVLLYNASGCLRSVLDESFYMYSDGKIVVDKNMDPFRDYACNLSETLSIHMSLFDVDMLDDNKKVVRQAMRTHYAIAFVDQQETDETISRKGVVQDSFNSPFKPFILTTTSIGQEGLDFHKYSRQVLHWSLPDNAIDLEQREGRINRYKNYSLRLNIAERYKGKVKANINKSVWVQLFEMAENDKELCGDNFDLTPFWHVPLTNYPLERLVPLYPFSKDSQRLEQLLNTLAIYRMALGQPNQEDLLKYILKNLSPQEIEDYKNRLLINLSPVAH